MANTLIVARNEFKYVAEAKTDFGELPPVVCCTGEMSQVFLNLVVNAAHAIAELAGNTGQKGLITIRTRRDGNQAVIIISDTGCGIPPSIRDKIFDPFFTAKPVGRGSGQGLAIVGESSTLMPLLFCIEAGRIFRLATSAANGQHWWPFSSALVA